VKKTKLTDSKTALGRQTQKIADYGTEKINQKTQYGYDRLGRQTSITGYAVSVTTQTTYTYDDADRITKVTYPDGNEIAYGYNAAGKVIEREDQRGTVTTYDCKHELPTYNARIANTGGYTSIIISALQGFPLLPLYPPLTL
jgi:YD repeat-containing protein